MMFARIVANLALVAVVAVASGPSTTAGGKKPYFEGDRLEFAFLDLEGRTVRSSDPRFRGKVLLVDLWATWCPPCIEEIPTFVDLQKRLGERGLTIVAIAFEDEDEEGASRRAQLREFAEKLGINYLVLDGRAPQDGDDGLPGLENVRGFPVEILVDRAGVPVEVRNGYGYSRRWARRLERELVELLDAPAPAPDSAPE